MLISLLEGKGVCLSFLYFQILSFPQNMLMKHLNVSTKGILSTFLCVFIYEQENAHCLVKIAFSFGLVLLHKITLIKM